MSEQNAVSFQSRGLIDTRAITTMGVSVKEGDHPIGKFGTGLKYAIAIILREGGTVSIWRGLEEYRFTTQDVTIRGKAVAIVCMNGAELGFTTHLGSHWKGWMAFREVYCNTMDEAGEAVAGEAPPLEGCTTVIVRHPEFLKTFRSLGQLILQTKPVYGNDQVEFHPGPSCDVFYRGVKVAEWPHAEPHRFAINILEETELTEDRTISGWWPVHQAYQNAVISSRDEKFIASVIGCGDKYADHSHDYSYTSVKASDEFMRVVAGLVTRGEIFNRQTMKVYSKNAPPPRPVESQLLPTEKATLSESLALLRSLGYPIDDYHLTVVDTLGPGVLGIANTEEKEILIAREAFRNADGSVAGTLLEEFVHIRFGHNDCTRGMQNWLVDEVIRFGKAYIHEKGKV